MFLIYLLLLKMKMKNHRLLLLVVNHRIITCSFLRSLKDQCQTRVEIDLKTSTTSWLAPTQSWTNIIISVCTFF